MAYMHEAERQQAVELLRWLGPQQDRSSLLRQIPSLCDWSQSLRDAFRCCLVWKPRRSLLSA